MPRGLPEARCRQHGRLDDCLGCPACNHSLSPMLSTFQSPLCRRSDHVLQCPRAMLEGSQGLTLAEANQKCQIDGIDKVCLHPFDDPHALSFPPDERVLSPESVSVTTQSPGHPSWRVDHDVRRAHGLPGSPGKNEIPTARLLEPSFRLGSEEGFLCVIPSVCVEGKSPNGPSVKFRGAD